MTCLVVVSRESGNIFYRDYTPLFHTTTSRLGGNLLPANAFSHLPGQKKTYSSSRRLCQEGLASSWLRTPLQIKSLRKIPPDPSFPKTGVLLSCLLLLPPEVACRLGTSTTPKRSKWPCAPRPDSVCSVGPETVPNHMSHHLNSLKG